MRDVPEIKDLAMVLRPRVNSTTSNDQRYPLGEATALAERTVSRGIATAFDTLRRVFEAPGEISTPAGPAVDGAGDGDGVGARAVSPGKRRRFTLRRRPRAQGAAPPTQE